MGPNMMRKPLTRPSQRADPILYLSRENVGKKQLGIPIQFQRKYHISRHCTHKTPDYSTQRYQIRDERFQYSNHVSPSTEVHTVGYSGGVLRAVLPQVGPAPDLGHPQVVGSQGAGHNRPVQHEHLEAKDLNQPPPHSSVWTGGEDRSQGLPRVSYWIYCKVTDFIQSSHGIHKNASNKNDSIFTQHKIGASVCQLCGTSLLVYIGNSFRAEQSGNTKNRACLQAASLTALAGMTVLTILGK